jgi:hypothetical protein
MNAALNLNVLLTLTKAMFSIHSASSVSPFAASAIEANADVADPQFPLHVSHMIPFHFHRRGAMTTANK